ncbi:MAG: metallophosphoesterase [Planctomyces sp.]|nr:metallophosphoesterase [Planctomyces sp.]
MLGAPRPITIGPAEGLLLDGAKDYLVIAENVAAAGKLLPKREMTVSAWVNLNATGPWGAIAGCLEDTGDYEKGWLLGYENGKFSFALASQGSDDGNGRMTYLTAKDPIELGRWYHIAGTYDGQMMKLYVNGQLAGESKAQSGDILYEPKSPYVVGAYKDSNEIYPWAGAFHEVKVYCRPLPAADFTAIAKKNDNLIRWNPPNDTKLEFLVKPYLQAVTQTSIVVMCETSRPATTTVTFAPRQPLSMKTASTSATLIQEVPLQELSPGSVYYYQVQCESPDGQKISSDILSFQTAFGADRPWAFGIVGDTQRNPVITAACADGLYALRPNFVIHCGDVVDNGFAKNQWIKDFFDPCHNLMSKTVVFPTIGNHEQNAHWYYDYFSLPKPEYHYTFEYGNAQFFMIDTNKPVGPGTEQYEWLEKELAKSKAMWKFTCHHHPCFTSDSDDYGNLTTGAGERKPTYGDVNAQKLVPLYEKYGVDIAWNGHIHVYERTWPIYQMTINQKKGVRYITSGGGGGHLEQAAAQRAWFSLHFKRAYHYCYVTAFDKTIQFKAYDTEGQLFDTFELTKELPEAVR